MATTIPTTSITATMTNDNHGNDLSDTRDVHHCDDHTYNNSLYVTIRRLLYAKEMTFKKRMA